ncbi:MAG: transposase [Janthinobacterium lividum]
MSYTRPYGRAQPARRVGQGVPLRGSGNVTVVGALTSTGLEAVMELDGALNEAAFATYLDQVLGPTLVLGDVVVLDNLGVHKMDGLAERVAVYGARLLFLSPYSPDFNPMELAWSKFKTAVRTAQARTRQALSDALTQACDWITKTDAQNWFAHCGYHVH